MTNLFTPRDGAERLSLQVSDEDYKKVRRGRMWRATVTDIPTGVVYKVRGAKCEFPHCMCDAVV